MKKKKQKKKKIYVFIDASNIIYGCTRAGWKMDFEKFIRYLKSRYKATRVFYYGGIDSENKRQLKFYELLQRLGYEVRMVPMKRFLDGTKKADIDSRMTFEIMKYLNDYDELIVCTGDGDFFWVLEYLLKEKKVPLRLLAHASSTAKELKKLVGSSRFQNIEDLRHLLEFEK